MESRKLVGTVVNSEVKVLPIYSPDELSKDTVFSCLVCGSKYEYNFKAVKRDSSGMYYMKCPKDGSIAVPVLENKIESVVDKGIVGISVVV